jgi:hypothetical protein
MMAPRTIILALLSSFSLHVSGAERLPADVRAFIDDREGCDHMRGEIPEPGDKQRMKELGREIDKLCKGTDRRLANLKRKYASDRDVTRRLNGFESSIEAHPTVPHR